jgi:predicted transcriptional regulator
MADSIVVTARLAAEAVEQLDALAERIDRSRAWIIQRAVESYVGKEMDFLNFVQEGIDAADRGDVISQEEMERWFDNRKARLATAAE